MKFFLRLLVGSAIFAAMARARSPLAEPVQVRLMDAVDQPIHGEDQKRQSAYYSDGSQQEYYDTYGDVQVAKPVTNCVTSIAKAGIKRGFPKCKAYVKQVLDFCRSPNGKKTRAKDCKSISVSVRIASDECDLLAKKRKPVSELCRALVPPKKSKADCKPNQLFGPVPGSSTPRCYDAPRKKQSKTRILPIRMYRPGQWFSGRKSAQLQNFTQAQSHDSTTAYIQGRTEKVKIHTLPVGQGDCTVIYCSPASGHAILFDCGAKGGNHLPITYFQSYLKLDDVKTITVMISHGHADHYNRIPDVFDVDTDDGKELINKIDQVIAGGPQADYQAKKIKNWLKDIKKPVIHISDTKKIVRYNFCNDKDIEFEVVAGWNNNARLKNQRGMVMRLSCESCGAELLLAGDMEGQVAKDMAKASEDDNNDEFWHFLSATHYKMSHHGASTAANEENWLYAIVPIEVHVSHMYNGRYKHPRCEALKRVWDYLGTTTPIGGGGHDLDCIENNGVITPITNTQKRIFTTAPVKDVLCAITLTFASDSKEEERAKTNVYCAKADNFIGASPTVLPDPKPDDGENEDD